MGKSVVVTRPSGPYAGAQRFVTKLRERGYEPFELPVLSCTPIPLTQETRLLLEGGADGVVATWLAFLSPTAVFVWRDLSQSEPIIRRCLSKASIAVQGSGTAEACRTCFGRHPDFIPSVFVAEEFARELARVLAHGQRVIVPQSAEGRDVLASTLLRQGIAATSLPTYRLETMRPPDETIVKYTDLPDEDTLVVFMSPSAVRATVQVVGQSLSGKKLISVGPITSQAIRKAGFSVWREAAEHSEDGVLAILEKFSQVS